MSAIAMSRQNIEVASGAQVGVIAERKLRVRVNSSLTVERMREGRRKASANAEVNSK
jgi:hypothetical protein